MNPHRTERVAEQLQHELVEILGQEIADPRLGSAIVTAVELSSGLRQAKVLVAVPPDAQRRGPLPAEPLRSLRNAAGYLRRALAERMQLRRMPELVFEYDRGRRSADRVETLLERIKKRSGSSTVSILLVFALSGAWAARSDSGAEVERYEASASIMGSVFRIAAYGEKRGALASAVLAAFEEGRRIDRLLSNYKSESELSRINRRAADGHVPVSAEMAQLLGQCLEYSRRSEGAFDLTVGPLMRVWGFYRGEGALPGAWSLRRARQKVGYQLLDFDSEQRTIRFQRSGVELDPGGIGKGYAVDRMADVLRQAGVETAMISAGSSSLYAMGHPPREARGWYVRLRHPQDSERTVGEAYLQDESLSTSGSHEKFFELDGTLYSHIMDPRTGMPAEGVWSVSVLSPKTIDSEAWATALFVNGLAWAQVHAPGGFRVFLCTDNGSCGWIEGSNDH